MDPRICPRGVTFTPQFASQAPTQAWAVPHLTTALQGAARTLSVASSTAAHRSSTGSRASGRNTRHPFYSSCDLRNSGFKLAPVDTNLSPAVSTI
ncbi:MAG: glutamate--cysteine ligase [Dechloromonas sp.]|uniref:Glutamate--cysteine ligase n=1 Tax=Candidatus Dechloromonas phosphorivorans TaxID=2899244 RepID=A0A9D7LT03_9RHOO|nr:glutamate--cysteine ligase [Candidatus Dechloromonas phosphorivorans]